MSYKPKLQIRFFHFTVAAEGTFAVCASVAIILVALVLSRF